MPAKKLTPLFSIDLADHHNFTSDTVAATMIRRAAYLIGRLKQNEMNKPVTVMPFDRFGAILGFEKTETVESLQDTIALAHGKYPDIHFILVYTEADDALTTYTE